MLSFLWDNTREYKISRTSKLEMVYYSPLEDGWLSVKDLDGFNCFVVVASTDLATLTLFYSGIRWCSGEERGIKGRGT
jgi:hypothetical protein